MLRPSVAARGDKKMCSAECRAAGNGYRLHVKAALPGALSEIVARTGLRPDTLRYQLMVMMQRGDCHVARLAEAPPDRGRCVPRFELYFEAGASEDPGVPRTLREALSYYCKKSIVAAMPGTQRQIIERTGLPQSSVSRLMGELREAGACHILRWRRAKLGPPMPVFIAGPGKDRPCRIEPMTSAERSARYMRKAERTGLIDLLRAKNAAAQRAKTMRKRGDPLVNALFGRRPAGAS